MARPFRNKKFRWKQLRKRSQASGRPASSKKSNDATPGSHGCSAKCRSAVHGHDVMWGAPTASARTSCDRCQQVAETTYLNCDVHEANQAMREQLRKAVKLYEMSQAFNGSRAHERIVHECAEHMRTGMDESRALLGQWDWGMRHMMTAPATCSQNRWTNSSDAALSNIRATAAFCSHSNPHDNSAAAREEAEESGTEVASLASTEEAEGIREVDESIDNGTREGQGSSSSSSSSRA